MTTVYYNFENHSRILVDYKQCKIIALGRHTAPSGLQSSRMPNSRLNLRL